MHKIRDGKTRILNQIPINIYMKTKTFMKTNLKNLLLSWLLIGGVIAFSSCDNEDDEPQPLMLQSITAGDSDLNQATSPTDVAPNAVIEAVFNVDLDETTVDETDVTLTRGYDDTEVPVDVSVSGNTVTITPQNDLGSGSEYTLVVSGDIESVDGESLDSFTRSFTTAGSFAPSGQIAFFSFEGSAEDMAGDYDPPAENVTDITYVDSKNADLGQAASFNGSTSLIEIPNADDFLANDDFSISFWVNADANEEGYFVMGLAGFFGFQFEIPGDWSWVKMAMRYSTPDGSVAEDSWFNGSGETKDNTGWQGWTVHEGLQNSVGEAYFIDQWAHVVVTYNAETKVNSMYINGDLVKQHDFNLWPEGDSKQNVTGVTYDGNPANNTLALGFFQGTENPTVTDPWADPTNPDNKFFSGELDNIRIFEDALTATEVDLIYQSENE